MHFSSYLIVILVVINFHSFFLLAFVALMNKEEVVNDSGKNFAK